MRQPPEVEPTFQIDGHSTPCFKDEGLILVLFHFFSFQLFQLFSLAVVHVFFFTIHFFLL